jgi:ABC-type sugar transport system substrate-binding protein
LQKLCKNPAETLQKYCKKAAEYLQKSCKKPAEVRTVTLGAPASRRPAVNASTTRRRDASAPRERGCSVAVPRCAQGKIIDPIAAFAADSTSETANTKVRMNRTTTSILLASVLTLFGCSKSSDNASNVGSGGGNGKKITVALMPKSKGNAYFMSCKEGADEAQKELGVDVIFDGPTDPDPAKQNEIVENWITLGVDVIAVACENKEGISTALRKARQKGIKVLTYDSDADTDTRSFFVNQATPEGIGYKLMDEAARLCNEEGEFAIITASLTAANMNEWQKHIEARRSSKYPNMKMVALRPCDDLKDKAQSEATALLSANPNLKLIMAICSPALPGAAEAVKQAGKAGVVKVIGLGLPSENNRYVKEGVTQSVILWKTIDLGYLAVQAATALAKGELKTGATTFKAGRLGEMQIKGDNILLGEPFIFNKDNIDQFKF